MDQTTAYDWIAAILTIGMLAIGLISMAVGWVMDRLPERTPHTAPADRRIMSRPASMRRPKRARQARVAATPPSARQLIAMPGNAGDDGLPGNAVAAPLPDEVRDIIRMQAKAEAVVALLESKRLTNKAEAIELIFGCRRSGRDGSPYKQAQALVDAQMTRYPNRTPEQEQARTELGLAAQ